ncbi:MAG: hypothetical protein SPD11_05140 [Sphaerochaetaceae bacterium]|nr:hypothetical protein [Sphaerochaetaceae bacterium]
MKISYIHASGTKRFLAILLLCMATAMPAFSLLITSDESISQSHTLSVLARPEQEETLAIIPFGVAESGESFNLNAYLGDTLPVGKVLMASNSPDQLTLTITCIYDTDKTGARFYSKTTRQSFSYDAYLRDASASLGDGTPIGSSLTVNVPQNINIPSPINASYWLDIKLPEKVDTVAANDYHTSLQVMLTKV